MIIISSLAGAHGAYDQLKPTRVISLLGEDEAAPRFANLSSDRHLVLWVDDESRGETIKAAARLRAEALVDFAATYDNDGPILVHCNRGVSRSTGAAFVLMCALSPNSDEDQLISLLRAKAPHADPCIMITSYADDLLGRDGRMVDAVEDLGPPSTILSAPAVTIDLPA